jgi:hypothetical protein
MASNNSQRIVHGVDNHAPHNIEDLNKLVQRSRNPTSNERRALQAQKESKLKNNTRISNYAKGAVVSRNFVAWYDSKF